MFVPSMGSKSGLKYCGVFVVFFPIVYSLLKIQIKYFYIVLFLVLLPFAVKEEISYKFMDANHNKLESEYQLPYVDRILTTSKRTNLAKQIQEEYLMYKEKKFNVIFYGLNSYMFNYSLRNSTIPFKTYTMDLNNIEEAKEALNIIKEKERTVFFVISNQVTDNPSYFEKSIINEDYNRKIYNGFAILIPNLDN
jgi:hypothetical protein